MEHSTEEIIEARRLRAEIAVSDFEHAAWNTARAVYLTHYWSGEAAPPERHAEARLLWSDAALLVRFVCAQAEPLVMNQTPHTDAKTVGLWDRDVCELFVAPDTNAPERYFEFEAAPTGEWLDLSLHKTAARRETDWQYESGMSIATRIREDMVMIAMRVPWTAFGMGKAPQIESCWRANLFRCIGAGAGRGYLAWRPTHTAQPNFHVPESFGWLCFKD
ncbi:MAG: carbohydrate-binding family 9-like protein [Pyrinomonadaceae bacterium]